MPSHAMAAASLPDELDVLVVGAGPAGAAVAAQLAGHCRVALVGRAVQAGRAIGETLPAAARVILSDLGVWDAFAAQGHRPAWSRRSLWGSSEVIFQDALFDPHGAVWHLDRKRFDARSEEHTSELQSQSNLVCRLLLEKKKHDTQPRLPPHRAAR